MPDLLDTHLLNQESPFDSIIDFTNNHQFIKGSDRNSFYKALKAFFAMHAFKDVTIKKQSEERLAQLDFPRLFHSMQLDLGDCCEAGYHQLLANISKVTGHFFSKNSPEDAVYQVCSPSSKNLVFWGWIPKRYVDASSMLQIKLDKSKGIIELKDLKPSALVALQRFQYCKNHSDNVDISLEALLDLYSFAMDFGIAPLKGELLTLFQSLDLKEEDLSELEELLPEYEINDKYQKALRSTSDATRSLVRQPDENSPSEWFDEGNPYQSIADFTGRCCTLPPEELPRFLSTVDTFFSRAALHDPPIAIPEKMKERFACIDLPFLLANQTSSSLDRKRFVAAVQKVTGLAFFQLKKRDRLHLILNTYGDDGLPKNKQTTWIPVREAKQCELKPGQKPSADERHHGFGDGTTHAIPVRSQATLPFFAVDEKKSLQYESPEQLVHFLCTALDYKVESWVKKVCLTLKEASETPAKWEECSQLLASHLGRADVCDALRRFDIPLPEPKIENLEAKQRWDLFSYNVGSKLKNPDEVQKRFLGLSPEKQLQALKYADSLTLTAKNACSLESPNVFVEKFCLALDLSLEPYVQKALEVIKNAKRDDWKWEWLCKYLGEVVDRDDVCEVLKELPSFAYKELSSDQLWRVFSHNFFEDTPDLQEKFMGLDHPRQVQALHFAPQLAEKSPLSDQPEDLATILCLALDLSLNTIVESASAKIHSLSKNKSQWKEFSTAIAPQLERKEVFSFMQKAEMPRLKPQGSDGLLYVFKFNMQQHGQSLEKARKVIESTFVEAGDRKSLLPLYLSHFKNEATPIQLEAIIPYLCRSVVDRIPPETEETLKACCTGVLNELTHPGFDLSASNVAACVQRHAQPYHDDSLRKKIYKLLTSDSLKDVFDECGFNRIRPAIQGAHESSTARIDEVFDTDSEEEAKFKEMFKDLMDVLCLPVDSMIKNGLKNFTSGTDHYLSDKNKLKLAKFWQAHGKQTTHKGHTLSKQQVWDALCTVYRTDVYLIIDRVKTHPSFANAKAKEFLLEILEYCTYGKHYLFKIQNLIEEKELEATDAKEVLDFIGRYLPDHHAVSNEKLKKFLTHLTARLLALSNPSMPEWMSSFLIAMGEKKDDEFAPRTIPHFDGGTPDYLNDPEAWMSSHKIKNLSVEQALEVGGFIQDNLRSWNNPFGQEIKQIFWNRFCNITDADLLLMLRDIDLEPNSKTFLESALMEIKGKDSQEDREIVAKALEENHIELEEANNLCEQIQVYSAKSTSNCVSERSEQFTERLSDAIKIWIEQENGIQRFLKPLPRNVQSALTQVMRRSFRTPKPTSFAAPHLSADETLRAARFLRSNDASLECAGKTVTAPEVWANFCEALQGDALLLRDNLKTNIKDERIKNFLLLALTLYESITDKNFYEKMGSLFKNLCTDLPPKEEEEKMETLKGLLDGLLKETPFVTEPLKEFLGKVADHIVVLMEIGKLREKFRDSEDMWSVITTLFYVKYNYLTASMPQRGDFSLSPLDNEENRQNAIAFFKEALRKDESSHGTTLLKDFWMILCSSLKLDLSLIQPEIDAQFAERPGLKTLVTQAICEKSDSVEVPSIKEEDATSIDAFLARVVQNNKMVSDKVKERAEKFLKKLWEHVQKEKVSQVYEERPNVKEALLYCLDSSSPYSKPPLTEAEIQQVAQFWQEKIDSVPPGLKSLKQAWWDNFCKVYEAHDVFLRNQIDSYFTDKANIAKFLKELFGELSEHTFYLDEDRQPALNRKIALAVKENTIGRVEARAVQDFLQSGVFKKAYVSKLLEKTTGRFVQYMGEIQNITKCVDRFDPDIRPAIEALIDRLCLVGETECKALAEEYPLTVGQMQRAVKEMETLTDDIQCLGRTTSPGKLKTMFCDVYSSLFLKSVIEAHFSEKKPCRDFLFNMIKTVKKCSHYYLEAPRFEELVVEQMQKCKIGLQEVKTMKTFLEGERETLFLTQDETINALTIKLIERFTAYIESNEAAKRFLGSAFEADDSVQNAMEQVIDRILANEESPDNLFKSIEEDITLSDEQKLAVATFLQRVEVPLTFRGRTVSVDEIWRGFCKAYKADSIPMVESIKNGVGFKGQNVLIKAVEKFVKYSFYLNKDKTDDFNKTMTESLNKEGISIRNAQEIKTFLEKYSNKPHKLHTQKLQVVIVRLTHFMQVYIERLQLIDRFFEKFNLSRLSSDHTVMKLLQLLWLPGLNLNEKKTYYMPMKTVQHFQRNEKQIQAWCKENCPALTVPTALELFQYLPEIKPLRVVAEFKEKIWHKTSLLGANMVLLENCCDFVDSSNLRDLDKYIDKEPSFKEEAAEIVEFLETEEVKEPFQTKGLSPFYDRLLGKMKTIQNPGLFGWFSKK